MFVVQTWFGFLLVIWNSFDKIKFLFLNLDAHLFWNNIIIKTEIIEVNGIGFDHSARSLLCLSHCACNSKNNSMSPQIHNHMSVTHPIRTYTYLYWFQSYKANICGGVNANENNKEPRCSSPSQLWNQLGDVQEGRRGGGGRDGGVFGGGRGKLVALDWVSSPWRSAGSGG